MPASPLTPRRRRRTKNPREYLNEAERLFVERARLNGWFASKLGWPDFLCLDRAGRLNVVEVKTKAHHRLRASQKLVMYQLARMGVRCWKWTPDGGFERLDLTARIPEEYAWLTRRVLTR